MHSSQPIFLFNSLACLGPIFGRKNARGGFEFRASEFSAYRARCDSNLGVVSDPLVLSGVAAGHNEAFFTVCAEPEWGIDGDAILAKSGHGNIFLASKFGRDGHSKYCMRQWVSPEPDGFTIALGTVAGTSIAREYAVVLQARDAQVDARSSQAPKKRAGSFQS